MGSQRGLLSEIRIPLWLSISLRIAAGREIERNRGGRERPKRSDDEIIIVFFALTAVEPRKKKEATEIVPSYRTKLSSSVEEDVQES